MEHEQGIQRDIEIQITGLTKKEMVKRQGAPICYLCKRGEGEQSVTVMVQSEEVVLQPVKLAEVVRTIDIKEGIYKAIYYLCAECMTLLKIEDEEIIIE